MQLNRRHICNSRYKWLGIRDKFCNFGQVGWKSEIIYWILEGHRRFYVEIKEWARFLRKITRTMFKKDTLKLISYRED